MTEAQAKSTQESTVGRIVFSPGAGEEYLFYVPSVTGRHLKILDGSFWSDSNIPTYGDVFRAPATVEALCWLRDNVGRLNLSPEVFKWYRSVTAVRPIKPYDQLPLKDYQLEAVGFLLDRDRAMLSLAPGLGKTLVSITATALDPSKKKVLVIAPKSLLYMWKAELLKWCNMLPICPRIHIWGGKNWIDQSFRENGKRIVDWYIGNPEALNSIMGNVQISTTGSVPHVLILDESILYKGRNSKRTKNALALAKMIPTAWMLTGAPANRMIDDMWSQFHILKPKQYRSYWRFAEEYGLVSNTAWSKTLLANKKNAEEVVKERFKDIYFAKSQDDVLNLPPFLFSEIDIPMTVEQEKSYNEMKTLLSTIFTDEEGRDNIVSVDSHLSEVIRLLQIASNPMLLEGKNTSGKWDAFQELFEQYPGPFVVWTSFTKSAKDLAVRFSKMGLTAAYMIGETKDYERQSIIDTFQAGKMDVLVAGQAVGSYGHTLTAGRTAFYPERTFDGSFFQSLYRIRRIGTVHSPNVVFMRSVYRDGRKTIDALVHSLLDYRVEMVHKLTTGMILDVIKQ